MYLLEVPHKNPPILTRFENRAWLEKAVVEAYADLDLTYEQALEQATEDLHAYRVWTVDDLRAVADPANAAVLRCAHQGDAILRLARIEWTCQTEDGFV